MQLRQYSTCNRLSARRHPLGHTPLSRSRTVKARAETVWGARIVSASPLIGDTSTKLKLKVVDAVTDERSPEYHIDEWDAPVPLMIDGVPGWSRTGYIKVPASFETPSAVLITKEASLPDKPSVDFISRLELLTPKDGLHEFIAESWVSSKHGERVFFGPTCLPKHTPKHLKDDRKEELKMLRGEGGERSEHRTYDYQPFDDLGPNRPTFAGLEWPLPRRCATKSREKSDLPYDEQFDYNKQQGFNGDSLSGILQGMKATTEFTFGMEPNALTAIPFFLAGAANKLAAKKGWQPFNKPVLDEFSDINKLFKEQIKLNPEAAEKIVEFTSLLQTGPLEAAAVGTPYKDPKSKADAKAKGNLAEPDKGGAFKRAFATLKGEMNGRKTNLDDLLSFPLPRVEQGRPGMWASDLEFGRQQLAGGNPCDLYALKEMPSKRGSAIGPEHVDAELKQLDLEGRTMQQLVEEAAAGKKPRLFIIDYWVLNAFWSVAPVKKDRAEHCGRAVFFLQEDKDGNETGLIPLAIELANRDTLNGSAGVVYSRHQLKAEKKDILWQLAKAVFRNLENIFMQLHSHWLRCHAVQEVYAISLRRNISSMHPVYKLMLPHFKYLMNININGRKGLLAEQGFLETLYTPNEWTSRYGSALYKGWRFRRQPLPVDLRRRGLIDADDNLLIKDYPYAQDGLDIWRAMRSYFIKYLRMYYKNGDDVLGDTELQAWWTEIKEKGHADLTALVTQEMQTKKKLTPEAAKAAAEVEIWDFAGPIDTVERLTYILTTMAFTGSAHHAAVNSGAYDFSAYLLNMSPNIRRNIPKPDAVEDPAYKALVNSTGKSQETEFLTYLASFGEILRVMTAFKVLSVLADGEHTIDESNTLLTDPEAVQLNEEFCNMMRALEVRFLNRNLDPKNWTRCKGKPESMEYTVLYPSVKPLTGVTLRGIPYSTAI